MKQLLKFAIKTITNICFIIVLALVVFLVIIPKLYGGTSLTILSGSMTPTYSPGDMVVTKQLSSPEDIHKNDVIVFMPYAQNDTYFVHRIIESNPKEDRFITKGDANGAPDEPIQYKQIVGKVMYSVPYVGYPITFIKNHITLPIILILLGIFIMGYALQKIIESNQKKSKKDISDKE